MLYFTVFVEKSELSQKISFSQRQFRSKHGGKLYELVIGLDCRHNPMTNSDIGRILFSLINLRKQLFFIIIWVEMNLAIYCICLTTVYVKLVIWLYF